MKKLSYLFSCLILMSCGVSKSIKNRPDLSTYKAHVPVVDFVTDELLQIDNNQLSKNEQGLWELYVKGDPLERGTITGALAQKLIHRQEEVFLSKIDELVPSKGYQKILRRFLAWYNRKVYQHVPNEYKAEIYGISQYVSDEYDYVADNYLRCLYLHGAHDIGHALQDLALVGCSAFAVWDDKTIDGGLLVGRNFDFYAGDDFAQEKIVAFVDPDQGHQYVSITWGGMIGVVSGMNEQGLTVSINAGKSSIPLQAKTPITLLNREILQYAATIEEAIAIARKRAVFVSESIMVASAKDGKAVIIEVSPKKFGVHEVDKSDNQIICSNHFQSDAYADDKRNNKHIKSSHSQYRYERMMELLAASPKISPQIAVDILRNKAGLQDKSIGYGNEKALNQLLAHHAVVFQPEELRIWVSSNPYQLGAFTAYELKDVFNKFEQRAKEENKAAFLLSKADLLIAKDTFLDTKAYQNYELFRNLRRAVLKNSKADIKIESTTLTTFENSNPDYWEVHYIIGEYFYNQKNYAAALSAFQKAKSKEVTTVPDMEKIEQYIKKTKRKL